MKLTPWSKRECCTPTKEFFDIDYPLSSFSLFPTLRKMEPLFKEGWYPAIDVSEDKDQITIKADLPGVNKEEINVAFDGRVLTIRGERKAEEEKKEKNYYRIERSYGSFERSIDLGTDVDESKAKAAYKNGVLEITVPKSDQSKVKKIEVEGT